MKVDEILEKPISIDHDISKMQKWIFPYEVCDKGIESLPQTLIF